MEFLVWIIIEIESDRVKVSYKIFLKTLSFFIELDSFVLRDFGSKLCKIWVIRRHAELLN